MFQLTFLLDCLLVCRHNHRGAKQAVDGFLIVSFSLNGANPSSDYERRRGSSASGITLHSPNANMRSSASVDRLNILAETGTGRRLPSMPDSMQRSAVKISGREGELAALKRSNRRSASSHSLVNDGKRRSFLPFHPSKGLLVYFVIFFAFQYVHDNHLMSSFFSLTL